MINLKKSSLVLIVDFKLKVYILSVEQTPKILFVGVALLFKKIKILDLAINFMKKSSRKIGKII